MWDFSQAGGSSIVPSEIKQVLMLVDNLRVWLTFALSASQVNLLQEFE